MRNATVDYLRPMLLGDTVEVSVRLDRLGRTSLTQRFEITNQHGDLCNVVGLAIVNVHLPTGRPLPIEGAVRQFLEALMVAQPDRVA